MNDDNTVLWWGRFDADYSRNRVLRQAFEEIGWVVEDFIPRNSMVGDLEASFRNVKIPNVVWVPSFRQRDVAAARRWATKFSVPLVFDPLISAYDKQVNERHLFNAESFLARRLLHKESKFFRCADFLVADTSAHAEYFRSELGVSDQKIYVVPVGAEEGVFFPIPPRPERSKIEVLFYGTFIDLQGPQIIVEAASLCKARDISWTLLGEGPLRKACEASVARLGLKNVFFEGWIDYKDLPARVGAADILLGVFSGSGKASRVIPNKVYQALACARPVVTRSSVAYPRDLSGGDNYGLIQIEPGSTEALSRAVERFASHPETIVTGSEDARQVYDRYFSSKAIRASLQTLLADIGMD